MIEIERCFDNKIDDLNTVDYNESNTPNKNDNNDDACIFHITLNPAEIVVNKRDDNVVGVVNENVENTNYKSCLLIN